MDALTKDNSRLKQDVAKAAEHGLGLLNKNKELSEQTIAQLAQIDKLKQKNHVLQQTVDLNKLSNFTAADFEELKDKLERSRSIEAIRKKHEAELQFKIAELSEQISTLEAENETVTFNLEQEKHFNEKIVEELKTFKENETFGGGNSGSIDAQLVIEVQKLNQNKVELEALIQSTESNLKLKIKEIDDLIKDLRQAQQECVDKDTEIRSTFHLLQESKDEIAELYGEMEILKLQQLDSNRRGNSIFAEVEDHRQVMEQELSKLRVKHKILSDKYANKELENLKLSQQMASFLSLRKGDPNAGYVRKVESMLSQSQGEVRELILKLGQAEEKCRTLENIETTNKAPSEMHFSTNKAAGSNTTTMFDNVAIVLIKQLRAEMAEKERQTQTLRLRWMGDCCKLSDCENKLYNAECKVNSLHSEIIRLQLHIEQLNKKIKTGQGKNSPDEPLKPLIRMEKIPGIGKENTEKETTTTECVQAQPKKSAKVKEQNNECKQS